jgi:hypothetical protein
MRKFFCCYNVELRNYLYQNGIKYDLCALNPNSKNMFWAYIRTQELDKKLTEWSNANKH